MSAITRHRTVAVNVGGVWVGGGHPVVVQSMTNTDTADAIGTAIQVQGLAQAGSELVRITVNSPEAAKEVAAIREQLDRMARALRLGRTQRNLQIHNLAKRLHAVTPRIKPYAERLNLLQRQQFAAMRAYVESKREKLEMAMASMNHLAPQRVLERGYSLTYDSAGQLVRDAALLREGDGLKISFAKGGARARVERAGREDRRAVRDAREHGVTVLTPGKASPGQKFQKGISALEKIHARYMRAGRSMPTREKSRMMRTRKTSICSSTPK